MRELSTAAVGEFVDATASGAGRGLIEEFFQGVTYSQPVLRKQALGDYHSFSLGDLLRGARDVRSITGLSRW